eukprot:CAMPEP_0180479946 /NCGR_PEP_ID=MMETSP1036_2-20121128/33566_1 /TAXON_ID=632150 /ORGANISM="Azadinium spinosum, Strain 3D9" /LENGTH=164 /DNA_ID=CAMNT_0022487533 /DNA_START=370 /DNA_END=864 /DNA_ORIENTATION=+
MVVSATALIGRSATPLVSDMASDPAEGIDATAPAGVPPCPSSAPPILSAATVSITCDSVADAAPLQTALATVSSSAALVVTELLLLSRASIIATAPCIASYRCLITSSTGVGPSNGIATANDLKSSHNWSTTLRKSEDDSNTEKLEGSANSRDAAQAKHTEYGG